MLLRVRNVSMLASLFVALALASSATAGAAQQDALVPESTAPSSPSKPPPGYAISARDAAAVAESLEAVKDLRAEHPDLRRRVSVPLYGAPGRFEVIYFGVTDGDGHGDDIRADVIVSGTTGEVLELWTGPQAGTPLARGYEPKVGKALNEPYVWLPLAALFLVPFFDPKRPLRLLHLDLLVLLAFGLSQLYFNRGDIDVSVPLVYPLLVYLLVRMLIAGFRPRERADRLVPHLPMRWMAIGLVLLVAFRIGLNVEDSKVIDVGYASVVGADRIAHGEELYVFNEVHGDTYGPVNYIAYLPFELLFPSDGTWGSVPAAHAAAIAFDLLTIVGLMLLGTRLRVGMEGRRLGLALAFAWAAYPYSLLALQENVNDGLIAALVVFALVALGSPPVRGALVGLAAAAKFGPLALAPLLAAGTREGRRWSWLWFALAGAATIAVAVVPFIPDGGLRELWDTTLGFQLGRRSPFSLWGLHPSLEWLQTALKVFAAALAIAVAFVPRRRSPTQVAALAAAALIAIQLPATHWFYFYLAWIAPPVLAAVFAGYRLPARVVGRMD